jgi:branched-chain amino acid transport system substrate-binding protein
VSHLGLKFYSASSWQRKSETSNNRDFVKHFEEFGKQEANVFGMLGYEIGLAIATMMPFLRKGDAIGAIQFLKNQKVIGPRGELNIQNQSSNFFPIIDINKINTNTTAVNQTVVSQSSAIGFDTSTIYQETVSGWLNPYLSV